MVYIIHEYNIIITNNRFHVNCIYRMNLKPSAPRNNETIIVTCSRGYWIKKIIIHVLLTDKVNVIYLSFVHYSNNSNNNNENNMQLLFNSIGLNCLFSWKRFENSWNRMILVASECGHQYSKDYNWSIFRFSILFAGFCFVFLYLNRIPNCVFNNQNWIGFIFLSASFRKRYRK